MSFPYRADHVGSLLRPPELLEARANPALTADRLREIEDRHILRLLERQKAVGLNIFTDGELRRTSFMSDLHDSVEGLDRGEALERNWAGGKLATLKGTVVAKLQQKRRLLKDQAEFLRMHAPGPVKVTIPTPNQFPAIAYRKGRSEAAYPTISDFLWDLVPIIKNEVQSLLAEGIAYVQIDAPRYTYYIDPKWRQYVLDEMGMDPDAALDEAIRVDNAVLEGARGRGAVIAIHLCRGNNRSQWYAQGGYDPIAGKLFGELNVDAFLLEYESERAGTFEPLRFVPQDKVVVLGLLSSKVPQMENEDDLVRRIEEASKFVPLERLALSPQCGFASVMEGNAVTEDDQWRKLDMVVRVARRVWG